MGCLGHNGCMRDISVDGGFRLDADLLPWEQQPGESNEQHAAFRRYCRLARRRSALDFYARLTNTRLPYIWVYARERLPRLTRL